MRIPADGYVVLLGDHFGRQARDCAGLAVRLSARLRARGGRYLVRDETVLGGIREVHRSVYRALDEDLPMSYASKHAVVVVGAADARGGGPPPAIFCEILASVLDVTTTREYRTTVVLAPPCPADRGNIRGYAKGSRRWLRRIRPVIDGHMSNREVGRASCSALFPVFPDELWADQLSLRPAGVDLLAESIAAVVVEQVRPALGVLPSS